MQCLLSVLSVQHVHCSMMVCNFEAHLDSDPPLAIRRRQQVRLSLLSARSIALRIRLTDRILFCGGAASCPPPFCRWAFSFHKCLVFSWELFFVTHTYAFTCLNSVYVGCVTSLHTKDECGKQAPPKGGSTPERQENGSNIQKKRMGANHQHPQAGGEEGSHTKRRLPSPPASEWCCVHPPGCMKKNVHSTWKYVISGRRGKPPPPKRRSGGSRTLSKRRREGSSHHPPRERRMNSSTQRNDG